MHLFETAAALNQHLDPLRAQGKSIGFVPTMGALHQGHLALVAHAAKDNDETVVSIFVNPTQFNNPEDLKKYPREPEQDIEKLQNTGCRIVFLPQVEEIYPDKIGSDNIDLGGLDTVMEGAHRPGHFNGVATVVGRFLELVKPNRAYFGEKDFQQLSIIRHLQKIKGLPVEIVSHPIERNEQGLALSSRNQLLSEGDREKALAIYRHLDWARKRYKEMSPEEIKNSISESFEREPLELEYVEIARESDLKPVESWNEDGRVRIFMAAHLSGVRLIDNLSLF